MQFNFGLRQLLLECEFRQGLDGGSIRLRGDPLQAKGIAVCLCSIRIAKTQVPSNGFQVTGSSLRPIVLCPGAGLPA